MGNTRASILDLDDEEDVALVDNLAASLTEIIEKPTPAKPSVNPDTVEAVAKTSGFTNRQHTKKRSDAPRRRRKKSPFTEQLGVKTRPGMKEIFQDLGELIGEYDHTTLERALFALMKETRGAEDILARFEELTNQPSSRHTPG
ncbi:MAG: hypothetical protein GY862_16825 [Gammaproteobacteria bacterium]|nr:hypothetical protein [Gammaproteobacteria bacterium]